MASAIMASLKLVVLLTCCGCACSSRLLSSIDSKPLGHIGPVRAALSGLGGGTGLFLTDDVEEDDELFSIPISACLTVDDACTDPDIGEAMQELAKSGEGAASVAIAAFVAKSWLCEGADGAFGPYLETLAWVANDNATQQTHTLWWSDEQVEQLHDTLAYDDVIGFRQMANVAADVVVDALVPPVRAALVQRGDLSGGASAEELVEDALRSAIVVVLSRAFEEGGDAPACLVPLLDCMQHSDTPNICHARCWDPETGGEMIVVRAATRLAAGTELVNHCAIDRLEACETRCTHSRCDLLPCAWQMATWNHTSIFHDSASYPMPTRAWRKSWHRGGLPASCWESVSVPRRVCSRGFRFRNPRRHASFHYPALVLWAWLGWARGRLSAGARRKYAEQAAASHGISWDEW